MDIVYITLILCLVASNLNRLRRIFNWLLEYFTRPQEPQLIPYFNEEGQLIGMVRMGPTIPLPHQRTFSSGSLQTREPVNLSRIQPSPSARPMRDINSLVSTPFSWDFWPDGEFRSFVSPGELLETENLATNWVLETTRNGGSPRAVKWDKGHELRRQCLGIIECHGVMCSFQLAPASRAVERHRQLRHPCVICGETLSHRLCGVQSSLFRFRDGAVFVHCGVHNHSTFTHSSLHHPDGSLAFLDYVPRYTVSIKESIALAVDSNDDHGGLFPGDSGVDPSIDSSIESLEEAHSGSEHIGSEEEREMREDPEAGTDDEIDELDDSD